MFPCVITMSVTPMKYNETKMELERKGRRRDIFFQQLSSWLLWNFCTSLFNQDDFTFNLRLTCFKVRVILLTLLPYTLMQRVVKQVTEWECNVFLSHVNFHSSTAAKSRGCFRDFFFPPWHNVMHQNSQQTISYLSPFSGSTCVSKAGLGLGVLASSLFLGSLEELPFQWPPGPF